MWEGKLSPKVRERIERAQQMLDEEHERDQAAELAAVKEAVEKKVA